MSEDAPTNPQTPNSSDEIVPKDRLGELIPELNNLTVQQRKDLANELAGQAEQELGIAPQTPTTEAPTPTQPETPSVENQQQ